MKSLLKAELDALLAVAGKHSKDDALLLSVVFNHGLRISEAINLTAANVVNGYLVVQRLKGSRKTTQPLFPGEREALEAKAAKIKGVFFLRHLDNRESARKQAWRLVQEYGAEAGIERFKCHPHALKHTTGRLGYEGGMGLPELQAYLGHENGKNTMVYAEAPEEVACKAFAAAVGK